MKIKWLKRAFQNLESIANYLQQNNPEIAIQIVLKIQTGIEKLADFPLMGRKGRVASTRELVIITANWNRSCHVCKPQKPCLDLIW